MSHKAKLQKFQFDTDSTTKFGKHNEFIGTVQRTNRDRAKLFIFYVAFYAGLALLFSICMITFREQYINPRVPRLQQEYSLIGNSPGLGFRPMPDDVRSTLIWYKGTQYEAYKFWEDQLVEFLLDYKKKGQTAGTGQNIFNCDFDKVIPYGKVCDFDIRNLGPCIQENHFSFHRSSPCVFLKLNRIYGWRPEILDVTNLPTDMPLDLQLHIKNTTFYEPAKENMVWVSCYGETPADQEMIGPIRYLPYQGFPGYFYPYMNAEGYLSPLVAVHFENPKTGILINVECRAWAQNINYSRKERLGMVHFELMVE